MKKIYIPENHGGLSWREIKWRATRHFELMAPFVFIYLWMSAYFCAKVIVDTPINPQWPAYYVLVGFGWGVNILFWGIVIYGQESAKKIYKEYI